jgi:hypothetical protein
VTAIPHSRRHFRFARNRGAGGSRATRGSLPPGQRRCAGRLARGDGGARCAVGTSWAPALRTGTRARIRSRAGEETSGAVMRSSSRRSHGLSARRWCRRGGDQKGTGMTRSAAKRARA